MKKNHIKDLTGTGDDYQDFYDYVSLQQDIEKRFNSFKDYKSYHFKDLYYIKQIIEEFKSGTVLDIGCCGTPYPELFNLEKTHYIGMDISQISLDRMREIYHNKKISWVKDDILKLETIEDESVDLILATQIFEHLPNPGEAFRTVINKLKIGGKLIIGTESSLFVQIATKSKFSAIIQELFLYLACPYLIYGRIPTFNLHYTPITINESTGKNININAIHGMFHPKYFEYEITKYELPVRIIFRRISGNILPDILIVKLSENLYFKWLNIKSKFPIYKYLGSQIFLIFEKTGSSFDKS